MDSTDSTLRPPDRLAALPDELPALYRSILDLVVELERSDGGPEARRIRAQALAAYGGAWDGSHQRRLQHLEARLVRAIAHRGRRSRRGPPLT
jgi:hypothetical protein